MAKRQRSLADRIDAARVRLTHYQVNRNDGQTEWVRDLREIDALLDHGERAWRRARRSADDSSADALAQLEHVVEELAHADDWRRRHSRIVNRLSPRGRSAFKKLVNAGCVAEVLVAAVFEEEHWGQGGDARKEMLTDRRKLERLLKSFDRLARACTDYARSPRHFRETKFGLDPKIERFLRREAVRIRNYLEDTTPRLKRRRGFDSLDSIMSAIKAMTGLYYDDELAAVLTDVTGRSITGEALRRQRASRARSKKAQ